VPDSSVGVHQQLPQRRVGKDGIEVHIALIGQTGPTIFPIEAGRFVPKTNTSSAASYREAYCLLYFRRYPIGPTSAVM